MTIKVSEGANNMDETGVEGGKCQQLKFVSITPPSATRAQHGLGEAHVQDDWE